MDTSAFASRSAIVHRAAVLSLAASLVVPAARAAAPPPSQAPAALQAAAESFVKRETAHLGGSVTVSVALPDPRLRLAPCDQMEAFAPPGTRMVGRTTVGVRCNSPTRWQVLLPATIQVSTTYFVAVRTLAAGHAVALEDLAMRQGDIGQLGADVVTDADQVIGLVVSGGIAAGQPVRADMLKQPPVVKQGQGVMLEVNGAGFRVSAEGVALNDAAAGQTAQVRTLNGTVVRGLARVGGVVEISQ